MSTKLVSWYHSPNHLCHYRVAVVVKLGGLEQITTDKSVELFLKHRIRNRLLNNTIHSNFATVQTYFKCNMLYNAGVNTSSTVTRHQQSLCYGIATVWAEYRENGIIQHRHIDKQTLSNLHKSYPFTHRIT